MYYVDTEGRYWDEVSHKLLESSGVIAARLDEIKQIYEHRVYEKVPIEECAECLSSGANVECEECADEESDGARPVAGQKAVHKPSAEEWDEHMRTHIPFRRWRPRVSVKIVLIRNHRKQLKRWSAKPRSSHSTI